MEGEGVVEVSDEDLDPELDPKEIGWSREKEESLNTLQKAAFELEKQVACIDKSNKRISGADSQANRFLSISIAIRQIEQNDNEILSKLSVMKKRRKYARVELQSRLRRMLRLHQPKWRQHRK